MLVYLVKVTFRKPSQITEVTRRFYNKKQAKECANRYYKAMYNGELDNVEGIYVDEAYEDDYIKPEKNYYEDEAA